jgi:DNA-binding response OmpR family regulator
LVLVIEDDELIAASLVRALGTRGYESSSVDSARGALAAIDERPPDLVLLDLGLSDGDGSVVAEHIARHHPTIPVVMLTARASELDVVLGLEAGAVDYVIKPFRLAELIARVGSHLRHRQAIARLAPTYSERVVVGDLEIDRPGRRVFVAGGEVPLRPKEFDVLARLVEEAGTVVTREQLIDDVWDENWWGSTKTLDVHINSIRRKLGEQPGAVSRISTVRGVGYRFDRSAERS